MKVDNGKWVKMDEGGFQWMKMDEVDISGKKLMKMGQNG